MPTYLCHGFRWHRQSILRQIVKNDLEDAALHWIIAPRSKVQIIQSFHDMLGLSGDEKDEAGTVSELAEAQPQPLAAKDTQATMPTPDKQAKAKTAAEASSSPPAIILLEEYNPEDLDTFAAPWAYVADYAKRIDTSASMFEEITCYETELTTRGLAGFAVSNTPTNASSSVSARWLEELNNKMQPDENIGWYVVVCGDEVRAEGDPEEGSDEEEDTDDDGNEGGN